MKIVKHLERLLLIFFWILLVSLGISALLVVYFTFFKGNNPFRETETINEGIQWFDVSWTLYSVVFSAFLAYGVLQLKKATYHISSNTYFTAEAILYFKKTRNAFIALGIILVVFHIISQLYFSQLFFFLVDTILFCYLFIFIIGVFFRLFGNAFTKGKELLEENELTV